MYPQPVEPEKGKRLCIVTPLYKDELSGDEWLSVRACQKYLSTYDCLIIAPQKLKGGKVHTQLREQYRWIWFDDDCFSGIDAYNRLLLSSAFYKIFDAYSFMLIYQTDALIFSKNIEEWLDRNYSYVGAPWLNNEEEQHKTSNLFKGVGNGGFSLRKISHMIQILSSNRKLYSFGHYVFNFYEPNGMSQYLKNAYNYFRYIERFNTAHNNPAYNEDKIIAVSSNRFNFVRIPEPEIALKFAFEVSPEILYEYNNQKMPLGCHAWNKYNPDFYRTHATEVLNPSTNRS